MSKTPTKSGSKKTTKKADPKKSDAKKPDPKAAIAAKTPAKSKAKDTKAENPRAVTGDNILTEDQQRAVFFNHLKLFKHAETAITEIEVELRAAKAELKNVKKLIQGEGTKLTDIDTALRLEDGGEKVLKGEIESQIKVAKWLGLPMGQSDLFGEDRRPAVDKAFEEGKIAGMKGVSRKPPYDPSVPQHQRWLEGYAEGQAILTKKFKPKETTDTPQGSKPDPKKAPETAAEKDAKPAEKPAGAVVDPKVQGASASPPKAPVAPPEDQSDNVVQLQQGGKQA